MSSLLAVSTAVQAAGLGQVQVLSALDQPLRATVPVLGSDSSDIKAACVKAKLATLDGALISAPVVHIAHGSGGLLIHLTTGVTIREPAATLLVELGCGAGVQRSYQVLLDPVTLPTTAAQKEAAITVHADPQVPKAALSASSVAATAKSSNSRGEDAVRRTAVKQPKEAAAKSEQTATQKTTRSVLRLSGPSLGEQEYADHASLKLAMTFSLSEASVLRSLQNTEPTAADWPEVVGLGNSGGETLPQVNAVEEKKLREKIQALEKETEQVKQRTASDKAMLENVIKENGWIASAAVGLALLLLSALTAIAWLIWRAQGMGRTDSRSLWKAATERDSDETLRLEPCATGLVISPTQHQPASATVSLLNKQCANDSGIAAPAHAVAAQVQQAADPARPHRDGTESLPLHAPQSVLSRVGGDADAGGVSHQQATYAAAHAAQRDIWMNGSDQLPVAAVAEISEVTHLVEFWMTLGKLDRAAELLETYTGQADYENYPLFFLYLFDLYRTLGQKAKYKALQERFQQAFNSKAPNWEESPNKDCSSGMAGLPHVLERIQQVWDSEQAVPFLRNLMIDKGNALKASFDLPAFQDILFLLHLAEELQRMQPDEKASGADANAQLLDEILIEPMDFITSAKLGSAAV